MALLDKKFDPATRLFDVECSCGGEFRVSLDVGPGSESARGFLADPVGQCPRCGLKLEEIEPPVTPAARSRA